MQEEKAIANEFHLLKVCVIIPAYNNAASLATVVQSVLHYTEHVIVVNDGSTDNTMEVLKKIPGLTVISYVKNVGKGWALRKAFQKALELGFDYAITMDADGQHFAVDLPDSLKN
jgi:glycosyltransferase involved in cell wall biosynthesis